VAAFEARYAQRLSLREHHAKLGAFWHTEGGPRNQVIHVYPYDDLAQRTAGREALAKDTARAQIPGGGECIVAQEAESMIPASFMRPLGSRDYGSGNVDEMRLYPLRHRPVPAGAGGVGHGCSRPGEVVALGGLLV